MVAYLAVTYRRARSRDNTDPRLLTCMAATVLCDLRCPALAPYSVPEQKPAKRGGFLLPDAAVPWRESRRPCYSKLPDATASSSNRTSVQR